MPPVFGRTGVSAVLASADRQARYGYFGLGENTIYDKNLRSDSIPFPYRVRRTRYRGVAELTRVIRGPFMAAFQLNVEQVRFTSLPGPSAFTADVPSGELEQNDAAGRLALIYDTRDNEYNTHQGLLLEVGTQVASGGPGNGYTRQYGIFRGWLQVREGTVVARASRRLGNGRPADTQRPVHTPGMGINGSGARGRIFSPVARYGTPDRQGCVVRQSRGPPRSSSVGGPRRGSRSSPSPTRGASSRKRISGSTTEDMKSEWRRRNRAPHPPVGHLDVQFCGWSGRVQLSRSAMAGRSSQATLATGSPAADRISRSVLSPRSRAYQLRTCGIELGLRDGRPVGHDPRLQHARSWSPVTQLAEYSSSTITMGIEREPLVR